MIIHLTGDHTTTAHVKRVAHLIKARPWPAVASPLLKNGLDKKMPKKLAVLSHQPSEEKLNELFFLSASLVIDSNVLDSALKDFLPHFSRRKLPNTIGLLLTSPVIYAANIAQVFTNALNRHIHFTQNQFEGIHLALHEAIVNGLIHGNLQVTSGLRQSARDFVEYAHLLNARLNDPSYAQKSIGITASWDKNRLEIRVRDEGAGYSPTTAHINQYQSNVRSKSGRGLKIIAGTADSCTIDDFGREVTLTFLLSEKNTYHWAENFADEASKAPAEKRLEDPDLSKCRVLVVEDNPSNQTVISRLLNIVGVTQIELASDGFDGIKKVSEYHPDLIILDITMPRMNGYEVLHLLKSNPETKDIPVLIQTASDNRETREKTFSSGATDFISKPVNPLEFFSRVKVHLENRLLIKNLEHQLAQIENEMNSAQKMQVGLLPDKKQIRMLKQKYGVESAQYFSPSSTLGGDFWQFFPVSKDVLCLYICDFSGHGVAAALNTFRLHALITQTSKKKTPSNILTSLNIQLCELLPRGQFATFSLGFINIRTGEAVYAGAGAPNPVVLHKGRTHLLNTDGMPLGINPHAKYQDRRYTIYPGDTLFLFSDALYESPNSDGARIGFENFVKMIKPHMKNSDVKQGLDSVMQAFFDYAPPPPPDDVTAVLVRFPQK